RASLGVAGVAAEHRFHIGPAALGTFTVLQLGVYAAMQIPTGILVDRFGSRRVLLAAATFMGLGQILLAEAGSYPLALLARAVLGLGDALTFVSVLRLAVGYFPARLFPIITALTATMGYLGNLAATVPLSAALHGHGWTPTFLLTGLVTIGYAWVASLWIRNGVPDASTPERRKPSARPTAPGVRAQLATAWRTPGTRLGFWVHFSTMFGPNALALLWGVPFLLGAEGRTPAQASELLTVFVFGSMIGGPAIGAVISRRPSARVPLALAYLCAALACWAIILLAPPLPDAALVPLFAFLALGGPASMIGFALARDYNPTPRVATATGVVNVGGFSATTLATLLIGVLLQATASLGPAASSRMSMLIVVAMLMFGLWRTVTWWRRARAVALHAQARGDGVPVTVRRQSWDLVAAAQ
ncbi:MAG: MFS transporter, partial [Sciscionella sp.]